MGKIGKGYGSEYHLQQWLLIHQPELDKRVSEALSLPGRSIEWVPGPRSKGGQVKEWKGIDFVSPNGDLKQQWKEFWPTGKGIHNWDAIGKITGDNGPEWLLVEAKAHTDEILTDCKASNPVSIKKLKDAFAKVKKSLGVDVDEDWMRGCYQFANRLATLWFLHEHKIPTHLLFIYFTGDKRPVSPNSKWNHHCPATVEEWKEPLTKQAELLGLPNSHSLTLNLHKLFLPVQDSL